ncbi:MAG TPA: phospholipase D-like domain-containing protein [Solimonas sp.]
MNLPTSWSWEHGLLLLGLMVASVASAHALLNKRDPRAVWGWIGVCWLFPFGGSLLYFLFGINRLEMRAHKLRPPTVNRRTRRQPRAHAQQRPALPANLGEVARTADVLTRLPLLPGNTLRPLHNGEQTYPAMLAAIDEARHSIALASYIYDPDRIGARIGDALARAQARGVQVRVLIDGYADLMTGWRASALLKRAGVPTARFHPPRLLPPSLHMNLRNHRKLLIVDGVHAFTGGMNISDRHYADDPTNPRPENDVHCELHGPIAAQLLATFCEDWHYAAGERWTPPTIEPATGGTAICRVLADGPNEDVGHLAQTLFAAISAAHHHIRIMTPYFLPPRELAAALEAAALRGVQVDVVIPKQNDQRGVHYAMRHGLPHLIDEGVRVYEQPPPFAHSKLFIIDDAYAHIGSTNFDPRSLRLNFELNVEVYDEGFAGALSAHFDAVRERSHRFEAEQLRRASLPVRLRNAFCWLFSPYL